MPDVAKLIQIITHMCKMIFNTFLIVSSEKSQNSTKWKKTDVKVSELVSNRDAVLYTVNLIMLWFA